MSQPRVRNAGIFWNDSNGTGRFGSPRSAGADAVGRPGQEQRLPRGQLAPPPASDRGLSRPSRALEPSPANHLAAYRVRLQAYA